MGVDAEDHRRLYVRTRRTAIVLLVGIAPLTFLIVVIAVSIVAFSLFGSRESDTMPRADRDKRTADSSTTCTGAL
jgi:hypothetical protein